MINAVKLFCPILLCHAVSNLHCIDSKSRAL